MRRCNKTPFARKAFSLSRRAVQRYVPKMRPDVCPVCGEVVPDNARACPECGADEKTGWSDAGRADSLGIPDDSFDYDDYVKREFEGENPKRKFGALWITVAILLLLAFVWFFLAPHWR
jgi:hypothetical protein